MSEDTPPTTSELFQIEVVLCAHASVAELMELDGILVNQEIDAEQRMAQAQTFVEHLVERASS